MPAARRNPSRDRAGSSPHLAPHPPGHPRATIGSLPPPHRRPSPGPGEQTLGAAIDWSYSMLSEEEKTLFRRLAVFRGGFSLRAAEQICHPDALDLLGSLVDKYLVAPFRAQRRPRDFGCSRPCASLPRTDSLKRAKPISCARSTALVPGLDRIVLVSRIDRHRRGCRTRSRNRQPRRCPRMVPGTAAPRPDHPDCLSNDRLLVGIRALGRNGRMER